MISTKYCIILRTASRKLKNSLQRCMIPSLCGRNESSSAPLQKPSTLAQVDYKGATDVNFTNEIQRKKEQILNVNDTSNSLDTENNSQEPYVVETKENQLSLLNDIQDGQPLQPIDPFTEDLSHIGPYELPSFNFAKYVNESTTLQLLVKLGVNLHKIEQINGAMKFLLTLDFHQHIQPYIQFYHDCGIPADSIGELFNKNIFILQQDMDDLHTRIRYLRAHNFTREMIQTIISKNPRWLNFSTREIDSRLGYFQNELKLNGSQVRIASTRAPKVITFNMLKIKEKTFVIREEMGFDSSEMKQLFVTVPKLWIKNRSFIVEAFDFAHNQMGYPHELIVHEPHILFCHKHRLEKRHKFLVELKKAQYDPTKPLYISPKTIVTGTDVEFCDNVAKTTIDTYNMFLKTF